MEFRRLIRKHGTDDLRRALTGGEHDVWIGRRTKVRWLRASIRRTPIQFTSRRATELGYVEEEQTKASVPALALMNHWQPGFRKQAMAVACPENTKAPRRELGVHSFL